MNNFLFILFIISVALGLIYFLYKLILGSESDNKKEEELQVTSQDILEQLKILYKQKKYNIVESLSKKYLIKKPYDDEIRVVLARSLNAVKRVYEAIDQLKIILKHQPGNFEMQIFLANCYSDVEKPMKSIAIFQEVLESDPNNAVAIKELAELYLATNQKKTAIKMYKRLEDFLYSNAEIINNKSIVARIYAEYLEFDNAIDEYLSILEIYPEDISAKKRLVEFYIITSNFDLAIKYAEELFLTAGTDADVLWALKKLMDIYSTLKNYEKALEYADLIKEHPLADQSELNEHIANILRQQGQFDDCITMLKDLIEKTPKNIEFKKSLAAAYEENNDFESAIDTYEEILEAIDASAVAKTHYEMSNIYSNWAMYLFSQNDNAGCFRKFGTSLEHYSQNSNTYYLIGNVNKLIKNFNEAISQFKKAIDLDKDNAEYYFAMAECYEEIDSIYEQKKALIDALSYNKNNAKAYYKLGIIFNSQNDSANAVSNLRKAVEFDDNYVLAKHKLALILEHLGNREEAMDLYESILKIEPNNEEIINNLRMLKSQDN